MKSQSNKVQSACDVKVYSDKGSLALRFPLRHNALWEAMDGKSLKGKPKCYGIGKYGFSADSPDDWKRASAIAAQLESDLDHPEWDKLFDRTLAKYGLGGGKYAKLADIIQLPGTVQSLPELTVGAMWEEYLQWKKTTIEETTFKNRYYTLTNAINGKLWDKLSRTRKIADNPLSGIRLDAKTEINATTALISISAHNKLSSALSEAFEYAKSKGLLVNPTTENPFVLDKFSVPAITTQQKYADKVVNGETVAWHETEDENTLENDRRAFTKVERDIIIKAFYESDKAANKQVAPLIEFLFLTGCRSGEAFALRWRDVFMGRDKNYIRFSKSYNGVLKNTQQTKTGETRIFKIYPKLRDLLLRIKPVDAQSNDLVFTNTNGGSYSTVAISQLWKMKSQRQGDKSYTYPGVVTQLVTDGLIDGYLPPYHTRHTFITLMAHAGTDLLLLATACGNSVEVIQRHYLGVNTDVEFPDI